MRTVLFCKHFTIPLVMALFLSILPAEATRWHSLRPQLVVPAQMVSEDSMTEHRAEANGLGERQTALPRVDEEKQEAPVPHRNLLEILFGRAAAQSMAPGEETELEMDRRMFHAVRLAERSARSCSIQRCWRYVKRALQGAGVVDCYPQTALAKQAAVELPARYGFKKIQVSDPFDAPVGAVLVYGGRGAGHVELRTESGFVSDHASIKPSPRPLIGVFIKPCEG